MDFTLPDSALAVRDGVAAVASKYGHDYWSRCDDEHRFPWELWQDLADGGWIGLGRFLVRTLLGAITGGVYTILTYLWPLWDEKKQTLDDKIFGTLVVRA